MKGFKIGQKEISDYIDGYLFASALILALFGLYSIFSITLNYENLVPFYKQLNIVIFCWLVTIVVAFLPIRIIKSLSFPAYLLGIILLILVLIFGTEVQGTKGWFRFGSFTFQPSEISKLAVILAAANFLSIEGISVKNIRGVSFLSAIFFVPITLILVQPDFGTSVVYLAIFWGLLYWNGFSPNVLFTLVFIPLAFLFKLKGWTEYFLVLIFCSVVVFYVNRAKLLPLVVVISIVALVSLAAPEVIDHLKPHQKARIETFVDPSKDIRGKGYNLTQSIFAIGSGGILGKGPLSGTQTQLRYVVAQSTDFVFTVTGEELGFIGSIILISAFAIFAFRVFKIALNCKDKFLSNAVFAYGVLFSFHFVWNISMVMGILPVMGIPLPFVSSGGTFYFVNSVLLGLVFNAYRRERI